MDLNLVNGLQRRSFVVRYLTLFAGEALGKVGVMAAFAYVARVLGPREFGIVELALSITVFFTLGAEGGLGSYGARMVASNPSDASTLIPRIGIIRTTLGLMFYVVVFGISWASGAEGLGILAIYGFTLLLTPFSTQWVFQGLRQMQWVAAGTAFRAVVFAIVVFSLVRAPADGIAVAVAEVCGAAALALFNTTLIRRVLKVRLVWRDVWPSAASLFRRTWYMGASDLAWAMSWYSPTVVLGAFAIGGEEVAWLASSVRIVLALHTFVWLYYFNLLPNLTKELREGIDGWRALIWRSLSTSTWASCLVVLVGLAMAPGIVRAIYGEAYAAATLTFRIVIWMIPITCFSGHFRFSLIAAGRQDLEFKCSAGAAVTTALAALAAGSAFGSTGAAVALLIGAIMHTALAGIAVWLTIGSVSLRPIARPVFTFIASVLVDATVTPLAGPVAGSTAACALFLTVALMQWDLVRLRHAWEGRMT